MKKTTEYQPLFSDILEDQEKLDADKVSDPEDRRGSTYLGVSYLSGELTDSERIHLRSHVLAIRKERRAVILFTVLHFFLAATLMVIRELYWWIYIACIIGGCVLVRWVILRRPLHKEAFPIACTILSGVLPYFILTCKDEADDDS